MKKLGDMIDARYGSHRGLVRLWLSHARAWIGAYRPYGRVDWLAVERLVFVCQGNVCRSPYGEVRARRDTDRVASIGLATTSGRLANEVAQAVAQQRGVDLTRHETTAIEDFQALDSDLFLVMEDRHIAPLRAALNDQLAAPPKIALLGLWARPKRPLIYDPIDRGVAYFETCYGIMDSAIDQLMAHYGAARPEATKRPSKASPL